MSYGNTAPPSPTDHILAFSGQAPKSPLGGASPKYQLEFGGMGFYMRRAKNYRPSKQKPRERRFSFAIFEKPQLASPTLNFQECRASRNRFKMGRERSTKRWDCPWDYQTFGETVAIPPIEAFDRTKMKHYVPKESRSRSPSGGRSKSPQPSHTVESDHEYYKKQEERQSNSFNRARRRSIELIESIDGRDHTAPTQSSRRKSVDFGEVEPNAPDTQNMSHADAAKAAAEWFAAQESTDDSEEATKRRRNRNNASRTRSGLGSGSPTLSPAESPALTGMPTPAVER